MSRMQVRRFVYRMRFHVARQTALRGNNVQYPAIAQPCHISHSASVTSSTPESKYSRRHAFPVREGPLSLSLNLSRRRLFGKHCRLQRAVVRVVQRTRSNGWVARQDSTRLGLCDQQVLLRNAMYDVYQQPPPFRPLLTGYPQTGSRESPTARHRRGSRLNKKNLILIDTERSIANLASYHRMCGRTPPF